MYSLPPGLVYQKQASFLISEESPGEGTEKGTLKELQELQRNVEARGL